MDYHDLHGDDEERVAIRVECSQDTFDGWRDFADGYATYEEALLDVIATWDTYPSSFGRGELDGADNSGDEKNIYIRCSTDTRQKFREFAAGYTSFEAAIEDAISTWDESPTLFVGRVSPGR